MNFERSAWHWVITKDQSRLTTFWYWWVKRVSPVLALYQHWTLKFKHCFILQFSFSTCFRDENTKYKWRFFLSSGVIEASLLDWRSEFKISLLDTITSLRLNNSCLASYNLLYQKSSFISCILISHAQGMSTWYWLQSRTMTVCTGLINLIFYLMTHFFLR